MKKIISFIIAFLLLIPSVETFGAKSIDELNKTYWKLQPLYDEALKSKDNARIIETGISIYNLLKGDGSSEESAKRFYENKNQIEINILFATCQEIARAGERMGDYKTAAEYYSITLAYGKYYEITQLLNPAQKSDYKFLASEINNKIKAYSTKFSVYTEISANGNDAVYYGAKHEPKTGVYYGAVAGYNPETKKYNNQMIVSNPKVNSGALIYAHFGEEAISSFKWLFDAYNDKCDIIELAWNLTKEGNGLADVLKQRKYIVESAKFLKSTNKKIFLRFAAEMNVWKKPADQKQYIDAFRFVSSIVKENAPNVAMVFSPNNISAQGLNYEMFYPGDEYVDWVGVSNYTLKHFLGRQDTDDITQSIYLTDKFANPVEQIRPIVETFGDRKPIMISEGGVENYSISNRKDVTEWAAAQLTKYYAYIPMVFPQVKAIFYFDKQFTGNSELYRFSLYNNNTINSLYKNLTNNPNFIPMGKTSSGIIYKLADKVSVPAKRVRLHTYFILPNNPEVTVTYSINGTQKASSSITPYTTELNMEDMPNGTYSIEINVSNAEGTLADYTIYAVKTSNTVRLLSDMPK